MSRGSCGLLPAAQDEGRQDSCSADPRIWRRCWASELVRRAAGYPSPSGLQWAMAAFSIFRSQSGDATKVRVPPGCSTTARGEGLVSSGKQHDGAVACWPKLSSSERDGSAD